MRQFALLVCTAYAVLMFRNGHVLGECLACHAVGTIICNTFCNSSKPSKPNNVTSTPQPDVPSKIVKADRNSNATGCELPNAATDDVLTLFGTLPSLNQLSAADKTSATLRLLSVARNRSTGGPLPIAVVVNLVTVYACTDRLLCALPRWAVADALLLIGTDDGRAMPDHVPPAIRARFLDQLLSSVPPGLLYSCVPRPVLAPVVGAAARPDVIGRLSERAAANLIVALAYSKPLFNCLPVPALVSLLAYVASAPPAIVWSHFAPSTVFGFLDGLLDTVRDAYPALANRVPGTLLAAVFNRTNAMTKRVLSLMPANGIANLVELLGSYPNVTRTLPAADVASLLSVVKSAPQLTRAINPVHLAGVLATVRSCPTILGQLPPNLLDELLDFIAIHSPGTFDCMPPW